MSSGAILPEPGLDDKERWGASQGPDMYPLVRHLGGVSLFDFGGFSADAYEVSYPLSNWYEFVPCPSRWPEAVWLEIDRAAVMSNFVGGTALVKIWNDFRLHRRRVMPIIEAAHLGPIPVASIVRVVPITAE